MLVHVKVGFLAAIACVGCAEVSDEPQRGARAATDATVHRVAAAQLVTQARCEREARCETIGPHWKYATSDACLAEVSAEIDEHLNEDACPSGIAKADVDACVDQIRNDSCDSAKEPLDRFSACRSAALCKAFRSSRR